MRSDSVFFSELEGIRGYAFLLVFLVHYSYPLTSHDHLWTYPLRLLADIAWIAVPIFFVLSGFLITGVLRRTLGREGYFRIFYLRRSLRVFPLYFLVIGSLGLAGLATGQRMSHFWPSLFYLQNVLPNATEHLRGIAWRGVPIEISHFWSLALEEQFYLLWPLVLWRFRSRQSLLRVCLVLLCAFSIIRFLCPVFGISAAQAYFSSFTRADAVVLGALLAICREQPIWTRLERLALPLASAGLLAMVLVKILASTSNPFLAPSTLWRVYWMVPLVNLTAASLVVETLRKGSRWQRLCQWRPIRKLGAMSYAAYVFHLLPCAFFCQVVFPFLQAHWSHRLALAATLTSAFALTLLMAWLSYRILETPAMRLKERLPYGPPVAAGAFASARASQQVTLSAPTLTWRHVPWGALPRRLRG